MDGIGLDGLNLEIYYQQLEPCKVGINKVSGSNDTVLVKQNHGESCQHQEIHRGLLVAIVPGYHIEALPDWVMKPDRGFNYKLVIPPED